MLLTAFAQSLASLTFWRRRSLANARPSLHANTSSVSGSDNPETVTDEAPKKTPELSRATAAIDPEAEFFEVAASTLIFAKSGGGGIHLALALLVLRSARGLGATW